MSQHIYTPASDEEVPVAPDVPSHYSKAIVAIITAVLVALILAMEDDEVGSVDLVNVAIALVTAIGVYYVTENQYVKAIVAFIGAGLQALLPFVINGDVTDQQWLIVLLAAIGALGVAVVPNVDPDRLARFNAFIARASASTMPAPQVTVTGGTSTTAPPLGPPGRPQPPVDPVAPADPPVY